MLRVSSVILAGSLVCSQTYAATPMMHSWDTVGDVMAAHGKYKAQPSDDEVVFAATHYNWFTTGTGCSLDNTTFTIEDDVQQFGARLKAVNPAIKVGMYWRSDFAMEVSQCSAFAAEWKAHPEWRLKDDSGAVIGTPNHYYYDYLQKDVRDFFAKVLVSSLSKMVNGKPVLDYVYVDGGSLLDQSFVPHGGKIGLQRSNQLVHAKYATLADVQNQLYALGHGQNAILNGMDTLAAAELHVPSGAVGSMFDHWSILQYIERSTKTGTDDGEFNKTMMDTAFQFTQNPILSNHTIQIKGWPGPIIQQKDMYPPNIPTPKTPAELQKDALDRFNSELALFLLVAEAKDFWIYSWFWGIYDYIGGNPASSVPPNFFPEAKCKLGAPNGQFQRVAGTWTYKRQFEHASVLVDLNDRNASKVTFDSC